MGLVMGCDGLRLAEHRADCAQNRGKKTTNRRVKVLKASIPQTWPEPIVVGRLSRGQITLY